MKGVEGKELKKKKIEVWISVQTKDQILSSQMYKKKFWEYWQLSGNF